MSVFCAVELKMVMRNVTEVIVWRLVCVICVFFIDGVERHGIACITKGYTPIYIEEGQRLPPEFLS